MAIPEEPELPGDRARGEFVIPGDHHRPDPGRPARADGLPRLLTRRIDHSDEPQEDEFGLHAAGVGHAWDGVEATVGSPSTRSAS